MKTQFLDTTQINELSLQELRHLFNDLQTENSYLVNIRLKAFQKSTDDYMEFLVSKNLDMQFFTFLADKKRKI